MNEQPLTMTVPELAARVGIDASTAYRYLQAGKLPGVHLGNGWLIDRERVERFAKGYEDAAGRPLVDATPTNEGPALTLLPERITTTGYPDTTETELMWLRGAHAAIGLLLGAAGTGAAEQGSDRRSLGA